MADSKLPSLDLLFSNPDLIVDWSPEAAAAALRRISALMPVLMNRAEQAKPSGPAPERMLNAQQAAELMGKSVGWVKDHARSLPFAFKPEGVQSWSFSETGLAKMDSPERRLRRKPYGYQKQTQSESREGGVNDNMSHAQNFVIAGFFFFAGLGHYTCGAGTSDGASPATTVIPGCVYLKSVLPPQGPFSTLEACETAETIMNQSSKDLVIYEPCQSGSDPVD